VPSRPDFPLRHAARRALHGVVARARGRGGRRLDLLGVQLQVPTGVPHPGLDPSAAFLLRTVGPMVAPGHTVLDVECGAGLGAMVAVSRGAAVVAMDGSAACRDATRANAEAAGVTVVTGTPEPGQLAIRDARPPHDLGSGGPVADGWDLVLWNAAQTSDAERGVVLATLPSLPSLIGETGRLLLVVEKGSGLQDEMARALPREYRAVELARDLGLRPAFAVLCLGFDREAARARRHAERNRSKEAKASVSRRKWEGKEESP